MKSILWLGLLYAGSCLGLSAQTTYIDFATPAQSATITFSLTNSFGLYTASQSFVLSDNATANLTFPTSTGSIYFSVADAGALTGGGQWSFSVQNPMLSSSQTITGFNVSFAGFIPQDGTTIAGVSFVSGSSSPALLAGTSGSFDASTGTLTLLNSSSFDIPANSTVTVVGNFQAAVPEPATYAAILSLCALGFTMVRRRVLRA